MYDPCCAFNCIAAGGRGSTCLDYDDTRPQVVCKACPSGTDVPGTSSAGGYSSAIQTSDVYVPNNSTTSAGASSYAVPPVETTAEPTTGNVSTSSPGLPTPTKDHDSGAAMVSVGAALGLGLLCAVLAL